MNRFIISTLIVILPYMALADTITEIKELRVKIKETSGEFRIVCEGSASGDVFRYTFRVGSDSSKYCAYLEREVDKYIKELEKLTDNYKNVWIEIKEKSYVYNESNFNEFGVYYFCNNRGLCS